MTESEFKSEVRVLTGYSTGDFPDSDLDSVISRAQSHIRTHRDVAENANWYTNHALEEALFWFTCLFAKVATGELDSQTVQMGAIDVDTLLAKENNDVTEWYRRASVALRSLQPSDVTTVTNVAREDRVYGSDEAGSDGISLN